MPVFPAYPSKGLMKSIVITKKITKRSLFIFPSSLEVVLAFTADFDRLDACASKKVYKKRCILNAALFAVIWIWIMDNTFFWKNKSQMFHYKEWWEGSSMNRSAKRQRLRAEIVRGIGHGWQFEIIPLFFRYWSDEKMTCKGYKNNKLSENWVCFEIRCYVPIFYFTVPR